MVVNLFAQKVDSLQQILKTTKEDTNKVRTLNVIASLCINNGNYDDALKYANQAQKLSQKLGYTRGEAKSYNQIGLVYYNKGDYADAISNQLNNLRYSEKLNNKTFIANAYDEIANIYDAQGTYENAIDYYGKSLELRKQLNNKEGLAKSYNNIGTIYDKLGRANKALDYYNKGLKLNLEINNNGEIANNYINIGVVYILGLPDYKKAIEFTEKGLRISEQYEYTDLMCIGYLNLGQIYCLQKKFKLSNTYYDKAISIAKDLGLKDNLKDGYLGMVSLDSSLGDYKAVYHNYRNFIIYRDSLRNEQNTKKTIEEQYKYEEEKKDAAAKAEQDKKDAIVAAENRRQTLVLWLIGIAGAGVSVVALLVFRSLQQNKKARKIIEIKSKETEEQKHLVEEKQKEIIDSITYAKRLQQAILPAEKEIKNRLPESFIYYQPKDIVAGDFYWMHTSNDSAYIAAADCTGHGVPGAMVSVVCSNALNRAVKEFNLTETGDILDKTRELVIETFEKSDAEVKDGMDISLLKITNKTKVQWSGANNSLWYILNNELIEVKADKQPIGKYSEAKPFTENNFTFNEPVTFYLFSDGYADQFSPDDKKLMKKKFKEVVLSVQGLPMQEQGNKIEKVHVDWKGNAEQTDDVLVIGIKL